jgi:precorrin-2 dehydrogenase / sirohydrochlorin ferrochelatase
LTVGWYPIVADLTARRCLVVGGGPVAEGKVHGLLAAGAEVVVVSPRLTPALDALVAEGRIAHEPRPYRAGDLAGVALAFVASDDPHVTEAVASEGRRRGVWVNAADDPAHCDFILPSVLRRGALTVAVSTGGVSPAMARAVRERLEGCVTEADGRMLEVAGRVRHELRARRRRPSAQTWRSALDDHLRRLAVEGGREEARRYLLARLGETPCE